jgi:hypothetical protein
VKVVSPYRPFVPESGSHQELGPFDWVGALEMLRASVRASCECETYALTDVDTTLPGPTYHYVTQERRLMIWLLEVALCYLCSDDFDDDTILMSPDALVVRDLRDWFRADLGVMVRTGKKYVDKPLLNGVQVWRVAAKDRLIAFYTQALAMARLCVPALIRWGADTAPLVDLLAPVVSGLSQRAGLSVFGFEAIGAFRAVTPADLTHPRQRPAVAIWDFKGPRRKREMAAFYRSLGIGEAVPC